jgi:integrase
LRVPEIVHPHHQIAVLQRQVRSPRLTKDRSAGPWHRVHLAGVTPIAAWTMQLDRYLRARSGHELAYRPELWLREGTRGPLDRSGIYQIVVRCGEECGVLLYPHRFRHHFCQAWLDRGGAVGDLMELAGWSTQQMIGVYGGSARRVPPQLRPRHGGQHLKASRLRRRPGSPASAAAGNSQSRDSAQIPADMNALLVIRHCHR